MKKRFEIGVKLCEALEELLDRTTEYDNGRSFSTKRRNRIVKTLTNLMREGTRQYEFSAIAATVISHEESYYKIKPLFIKNKLWSDDFINLEQEIKFCALEVS